MVTINIGRKEAVFFGVILLVFVIAGFAIAFGGNQPEVMGHSADEIEESGFGEWETTDVGQVGGTGVNLVKGVVYQAESDGIVIAMSGASNAEVDASGWVADSSVSDANVKVAGNKVAHNSYKGETNSRRVTVTFPVKEGNKWEVAYTDIDGTAVVRWLPFS